ncbi:HD-GYP domain-containing protein [Clostridium merdae]|uniref:HD-GYP domain-containing protein n=1 Tax=Clostridium merdae TaxID=1958780 RepID=UPI000A27203D|nr:HD domain-containing phosphohydrolase [Clostridium merdae]
MKGINEIVSADEILHLLPEEQIQHSINVGKLMEYFSVWLSGYADQPMLQYYSLAAYYHDIGKAYVPAELLTKTGILATEEYRLIQQHTVYARKWLESAGRENVAVIPKEILDLLFDAAVYHHEHWDGTGYPYGKKGLEIPLVARATAVCDAYDAMVSGRSYRPAFSHDYACGELKRGAGRQFDPELVKLFLEYQEKNE